MRHILALTAGLIAGVAGASIGGPVTGFAGLVSVFLSIEAVSPQNGAYRVWGHSDITYWLRREQRLQNQTIYRTMCKRSQSQAYTGVTIRLDR